MIVNFKIQFDLLPYLGKTFVMKYVHGLHTPVEPLNATPSQYSKYIDECNKVRKEIQKMDAEIEKVFKSIKEKHPQYNLYSYELSMQVTYPTTIWMICKGRRI